MNRTMLLWLVILTLFSGGCARLKPSPPMPEVMALPPATLGAIAGAADRFTRDHAESAAGFLILTGAAEAFTWRQALLDEATRSVDIQYFIWENDEAGILLFHHLLSAADRGVRVRLLVDDIGLAAKDRTLAALCLHPNLEIKIFNPGHVRNSILGGAIEFIGNLKELNRRMHNKLMIVDGRMAVVGGRNIGNAYFGISPTYNFRDLDLLVTGAVVPQLSTAYDLYWNAELAYPGRSMSDQVTAKDLASVRGGIESFMGTHLNRLAAYTSPPGSWQARFDDMRGRWLSGTAHFIQDQPVRIGEEEFRLTDILQTVVRPTGEELFIVSPYLIPGAEFFKRLEALAFQGVRVQLLTASLGANNHVAAHSHYRKYRRKMLRSGAHLFEMKHDLPADTRRAIDVPPVTAAFSCLHVKAMVADRGRCVVGSLNLDPRAVRWNTENVLYVESEALCGRLAEQFATLMGPQNAWQVFIDEHNRLRWTSDAGIVDRQPARSMGQRIADFFFRLLPLEGQL